MSFKKNILLLLLFKHLNQLCNSQKKLQEKTFKFLKITVQAVLAYKRTTNLQNYRQKLLCRFLIRKLIKQTNFMSVLIKCSI